MQTIYRERKWETNSETRQKNLTYIFVNFIMLPSLQGDLSSYYLSN